MSATFTDAEYPADPYPGAVPDCSFVHADGVGYRLRPDPTAFAGWRVEDTPGGPCQHGADLDDWLAGHAVAPMAGRLPVLSYGSNQCPSKITWMRRELGLTGPVVVLRAATRDVAAVWAAGFRQRDGQRPAVLAAAPGVEERHALWLATPEQVAVLDRCEGRGERYRLARLGPATTAGSATAGTGTVRTEDGAVIERPWCYLGRAAMRRPLLVDGHPVRCADVDQHTAATLLGRPAGTDGLAAAEVAGAPHPDQWPGAVFGYGLLQPGQPGWPQLAPHLAPHLDDRPRPAYARGTLFDTGRGWPGMLRSGADPIPGTLVPLREPGTALPALDAYEGPDYRRVRVMLSGGTVAWAYVWVAGTAGMRRLSDGWPVNPASCCPRRARR